MRTTTTRRRRMSRACPSRRVRRVGVQRRRTSGPCTGSCFAGAAAGTAAVPRSPRRSARSRPTPRRVMSTRIPRRCRCRWFHGTNARVAATRARRRRLWRFSPRCTAGSAPWAERPRGRTAAWRTSSRRSSMMPSPWPPVRCPRGRTRCSAARGSFSRSRLGCDTSTAPRLARAGR